MNDNSLPAIARELIVPAIMLGCVALFVADSMRLSLEAWIFPAGLIVVIVAALAVALWPVLTGKAAAAPPPTEDGDEEDATGPILAARPWLLLAIPTVLCAFLSSISVPVALVLAVAAAQRMLGERSLVRNALIPLAIVVPTWLLFKYLLFVRFPPNLLGL